jgi:hypothetical protein
MATTDARTGFRLPWSSDRSTETEDSTATSEAADTGWSDGSVAVEVAPDPAPAQEPQPAHDDATGEAASGTVATAESATPEAPAAATAPAAEAAPRPPAKKPNRFLADLAKAMQAAAEEARGQSLAQLQADAKAHVESIHDRSSTDAAALRRRADDDVAAVREWSKAEIARIREETEQKITARKARLETEIDQHAAVIEREIEAVQRTVASFETEMAAFFERLVTEEDPTRFAAMAENLPEPPTFDDLTEAMARLDDEAYEARLASATTSTDVADTADAVAASAAVETADVADVEPSAVADVTSAEIATTDAEASVATDATDVTDTTAETARATVADDVANAESAADVPATGTVESADEGDAASTFVEVQADPSADHENGAVDREAAFAAIQAAAEAAAAEESDAQSATTADDAAETVENPESATAEDPRFAALGLSPDLAAAEAEALEAADQSDAEEIPTIADDALAARLAGLVPPVGADAGTDVASTQVVVVGLVSVASIASFKRHLGRLAGVRSVGVSSGPEGEFIFAVSHEPEANLRDAIPSLPSFQARVTSASDGAINVTAHDPEADG